ncbi:MAG: hypothetical protein ACJ71K_21730 [Nitrososphaeraceae archaeon]
MLGSRDTALSNKNRREKAKQMKRDGRGAHDSVFCHYYMCSLWAPSHLSSFILTTSIQDHFASMEHKRSGGICWHIRKFKIKAVDVLALIFFLLSLVLQEFK